MLVLTLATGLAVAYQENAGQSEPMVAGFLLIDGDEHCQMILIGREGGACRP